MSAPLFVIADGMGGHAFGDRASRAAIATFADALMDDAPASPTVVLETVTRANDAVLELPVGRDALSGTTLTGVAFVDLDAAGNDHWMAFNVGDSRSYSWDSRTLSQLSVDHSVVQELVDSGVLIKAEAERHPQRNVVTRALGTDDTVDADIWLLPAVVETRSLLSIIRRPGYFPWMTRRPRARRSRHPGRAGLRSPHPRRVILSRHVFRSAPSSLPRRGLAACLPRRGAVLHSNTNEGRALDRRRTRA